VDEEDFPVIASVFLSGVQLLLAVVLSALAAYLGVWLFSRATPGLDEWAELRKGNPAVGVVMGAVVVGVAIILRPALNIVSLRLDVGATLDVALRLLTQALLVAVGLVLSLAAIAFALWLFTRLTGELDEWAEIAKGNVGVAALLAGVILGTALLSGVALDSALVLLFP
jgi:uncharacterized membrane protein YjfL (UPF0719 family)